MDLLQLKSSTPRLPSALFYGRDLPLLETRCWVLEHAGFTASPTVDIKEAAHMIDGGLADLFILCHPLPAKECQSILSRAHSMRPRMKILILGRSRLEYYDKGDVMLDTFISPQRLIATARKLLHSSFVPSQPLDLQSGN